LRGHLILGLLCCGLLWLSGTTLARQPSETGSDEGTEPVRKPVQPPPEQEDGASPRRFQPSESLSADSAVSFPVDI